VYARDVKRPTIHAIKHRAVRCGARVLLASLALAACERATAPTTTEPTQPATPEPTTPPVAGTPTPQTPTEPATPETPRVVVSQPLPEETHLGELKQLTFGGENAEAYLSGDEAKLVFQSTRDGAKCDQIYTMGIDGQNVTRVSSGKGRTTCAYYLPGDQRILYASTHAAADDCLPPPDRSHGYVWKLYDEFDIYTANADGSDVQPLVQGKGYDAEATVSPKGDRIVFTSTRDGDPELYSMKIDGTDQKRLTKTAGYDGGAFFSLDGKQIVYRANHPKGKDELDKYRAIIEQGLVRPTRLELFVMNADGKKNRQITSNGKANFGPFFHPDGKRIIFASNAHDPKGRDFDLYIVGTDGKNLERVTHNPSFDGFPMFTKDGKHLVFASNRNAASEGDTNVFVAEWKD
jgi:Tol biopolymer transport system component